MSSVGGKLREIHILQPSPGTNQPFALKAGQAIFDISGVLSPSLLPIIDNVQSGVNLPLDHLSYCLMGAGIKSGLV